MSRDVVDGIQLMLPGLEDCEGDPGRVPSEDEIEHALIEGSKMAVFKRHRGCPPECVDREFESFYQEIRANAAPRLKKFRHGGKHSLLTYAYMACSFALLDIQRRALPASDSRLTPAQREALQAEHTNRSYPLLDARH